MCAKIQVFAEALDFAGAMSYHKDKEVVLWYGQ